MEPGGRDWVGRSLTVCVTLITNGTKTLGTMRQFLAPERCHAQKVERTPLPASPFSPRPQPIPLT